MNAEKILQDHLGSISMEIGKIDNTVMSTEKMPVSQLSILRKKRVELQETAEYVKYLLYSIKQQQEEESGIVKPDNKIITMQ